MRFRCVVSLVGAFLSGFTTGAVFSDLFAELCAADFPEQIDDVFKRRVHERFGALVLRKNLDAGFVTDARHLEPFDFKVLFAFTALIRNGESVRFIAGILQKL